MLKYPPCGTDAAAKLPAMQTGTVPGLQPGDSHGDKHLQGCYIQWAGWFGLVGVVFASITFRIQAE